MKNIPEEIHLVIGDDGLEYDDFNELGEVTWCADSIYDSDLIYQRKPIWHDLRKNPKDLPCKYPEYTRQIKSEYYNPLENSTLLVDKFIVDNVAVIYEGEEKKIHFDGMIYNRYNNFGWEWYSKKQKKTVIAWMYIHIPKFKG